MIISRCLQVLILIVYSNFAAAQLTNEKQSLCISVDEDYLNFRGAGTDRYYTFGFRVDYFFEKKKNIKFPSNLLLRISDNHNLYSWGGVQLMFTPKNIQATEVLYDDRPYAGALYGTHTLQSFNSDSKTKVSSEINLGVIGPLSLAEQTQIVSHRIIHYTKPNGWKNQVPNDLIINYNITVEKQLLKPSKRILLNAFVQTFNGTLYNAAGIGFFLRVGKFTDYFKETDPQVKRKKNDFQLYVSIKPGARVVLSNALLQGGLLNQLNHQKKGFTLKNDQIERFIVLYDGGVTFEIYKFSISITQKMNTAEFKGQFAQETGTVTVQFRL